MAVRLALWDFDGTVAKGDSVIPWVKWLLRQHEMSLSDLLRLGAAFLRYRFRKIDIITFKETTMAFLQGKTEQEADALAENFWQQVLSRNLFPAAVAEMKRQRAQGLTVLLVSASTDCYMRTVAGHLPVSGLLCTRCEMGENGRYTGHLTGKNCRGEEKIRRIQQYLLQNNLPSDTEIVSAWGDSCADLPMLRLAQTAHAINPRRKMQQQLPAGAVIEHFHK